MNNFGRVNSSTSPANPKSIVLISYELMFHCIMNKLLLIFYVGFTCNGHKDRTDIHFKSK